MTLKGNFRRGGGFNWKNLPWDRVWIFSGTTQSKHDQNHSGILLVANQTSSWSITKPIKTTTEILETCEVFLCFVAIVWVRSIMLTSIILCFHCFTSLHGGECQVFNTED